MKAKFIENCLFTVFILMELVSIYLMVKNRGTFVFLIPAGLAMVCILASTIIPEKVANYYENS